MQTTELKLRGQSLDHQFTINMQRNLIKHDFYLFNGVSAAEEGNRIPANTLYYAENSRFEGGRWASRQGYTAFGDAQAGGTNIKGLMKYERFPSGVSTPYVVAYYNSKFYRYTMDGAATEITPAAWTADDIDVEGIDYNGSLYVADGTNRIGKIADTVFSVSATAPRARLLATWKEKMVAVDNAAPSTAQYTATATASSPSNIEDWTTVGAAGAELIGKGGRIESLRELDEKLYIFKANYIEAFTGIDLSGASPVITREPVSKNIGTVGHRATCIVENDIWFVAPNLEIHSLGQIANYLNETRTRDMSAVIKRHKSDLDPDQSGAVMWYNNGILKIAFKELGSSQNNLVFVYDLTQPNTWSFDRATSPKVAATVDGKAFFAVDGTSGQLYRDENSYSDNGFPMSWGGKTGLVDDGRADQYKYARYLYARGARSEDVVITFYLLGEDFERLETLTLPEPTAAEIAAGGTVVAGDWGMVGDIVGGGGYTGPEAGAPPVYRFNYPFSVGSTARMFGVEVESSLNAQRAFIDEVKLKYIPRPEKYDPVN